MKTNHSQTTNNVDKRFSNLLEQLEPLQREMVTNYANAIMQAEKISEKELEQVTNYARAVRNVLFPSGVRSIPPANTGT